MKKRRRIVPELWAQISRKVLFGTFSGTICVNIGTKSRAVQFCACTGAHFVCFINKGTGTIFDKFYYNYMI